MEEKTNLVYSSVCSVAVLKQCINLLWKGNNHGSEKDKQNRTEGNPQKRPEGTQDSGRDSQERCEPDEDIRIHGTPQAHQRKTAHAAA